MLDHLLYCGVSCVTPNSGLQKFAAREWTHSVEAFVIPALRQQCNVCRWPTTRGSALRRSATSINQKRESHAAANMALLMECKTL